MGIGSFLKIERMKRGMTQADLADGIISISHLSKIENNHIEPSEEIKNCLLKRLNIKNYCSNKHLISKLTRNLNNWEHYLNIRELEGAKELYEDIKLQIDEVQDPYLQIYFKIFQVMYLQMTSFKAVETHYIESLRNGEKLVSEGLKYYYYKVIGDYHFLRGEYLTAEQCLKKAAQQLKVANTAKDEEADFYYLYALVNSYLKHTYIALEYTNKAIDLFQKLYNFKYCVKCHMLLGIQYSRLSLFPEAKNSFNEGKKLAIKVGYREVIGQINQNLGHISALEGDEVNALKLFKSSYEEKVKTKEKLITVKSIIKIYLNKSSMQALEWVREGLSLITSEEDQNTYKALYFELRMYLLVLEHNPALEQFIQEEVIGYADSNKNIELKAAATEHLANYYWSQGKYKKACTYFIELKDIYQKTIVGGINL